eukprot:GILJ01005749.1.p1 GENE.GILJ01005749.1~~GILJ01005749.1.p1  ORF type:complete len:280 (-),score=50.51 GILJ01005749.1:72-911(-)
MKRAIFVCLCSLLLLHLASAGGSGPTPSTSPPQKQVSADNMASQEHIPTDAQDLDESDTMEMDETMADNLEAALRAAFMASDTDKDGVIDRAALHKLFLLVIFGEDAFDHEESKPVSLVHEMLASYAETKPNSIPFDLVLEWVASGDVMNYMQKWRELRLQLIMEKATKDAARMLAEAENAFHDAHVEPTEEAKTAQLGELNTTEASVDGSNDNGTTEEPEVGTVVGHEEAEQPTAPPAEVEPHTTEVAEEETTNTQARPGDEETPMQIPLQSEPKEDL